MKKLLLLTILCLTFSACKKAAPDPFSGDFACEVAFACGGTEYTLCYEKAGERETAAVTAPATLAGLCAVRDGGTVTLSHGEFSFTALAGDGIFGFAECLTPRELQVTAENGGYRCTAADYTLYTDGEGLPLRIVSGRYDLHFHRFQGGDTQ